MEGSKRPSGKCLKDPARRDFLKRFGAVALVLGGACLGFPQDSRAEGLPRKGRATPRPSPFFTPLSEGVLRCDLCPRQCEIPEGERGFCGTRVNRNGRGYTLAYGNPCAVNLDPIERVPFLHVLPGSRVLCVATAGCTFHCAFCENWAFSQARPEAVHTYDLPPEAVVTRAASMDARAVAYAYVEPAVFFEYMLDTARRARDAGLYNVMHTNGFLSPEPLSQLSSVLDAAQVDLKGFDESFYRRLCQGRLQPVLETLERLRLEGVHVEITNLLIPGENDAPRTIRDMCRWIAGTLGPDTPLHFARFYPLYRLTRLAPTPVASLEAAREKALAAGLRYVYIGGVPDHPAWSTSCPECGARVIHRRGYVVEDMGLREGRCAHCGLPVPGLWGTGSTESTQRTSS